MGVLRAAELAQRFAPVGMTVVEDGETVALLPQRARKRPFSVR